jgi:hypothetical protein
MIFWATKTETYWIAEIETKTENRPHKDEDLQESHAKKHLLRIESRSPNKLGELWEEQKTWYSQNGKQQFQFHSKNVVMMKMVKLGFEAFGGNDCVSDVILQSWRLGLDPGGKHNERNGSKRFWLYIFFSFQKTRLLGLLSP